MASSATAPPVDPAVWIFGISAVRKVQRAAPLPLLAADGEVEAVAELAIDYANWIAADSSRVLPGAASMDTLTAASCPEIRTNVLKIIGSDSFATVSYT